MERRNLKILSHDCDMDRLKRLTYDRFVNLADQEPAPVTEEIRPEPAAPQKNDDEITWPMVGAAALMVLTLLGCVWSAFTLL